MKTLKTGGRDIRLHNRSRILEYVYMRGQTTKQQLVEIGRASCRERV